MREILHPVIAANDDGSVVRGFNPPEHMRFASRESVNGFDAVVFFKAEADMIAFDNRDCESLHDKRLLDRGKYLEGVINDRD